jgi:uncharacterized protein YkwD
MIVNVIGYYQVMTNMVDKNRVDAFPLLIIFFSCIVIFYLLRPPILMFLNYQLSWLGNGVNYSTLQTPQGIQPTPPLTIEPPTLPSSLEDAPDIWAENIPADVDRDALNAHIFNITNQERTDVSRSTLQLEAELGMIAARHSKDMLDNDYMDHISPQGDGPAQRAHMQHRKLFATTGENVAMILSPEDTPQAIAKWFMQSWMNSLGHRRNILSADYTHLGVGCYQQPKQSQINRYCTQLFAKVAAMATSNIPSKVQRGNKLTIELKPAEGMPLPTKIKLVRLDNGEEGGDIDLISRTNYATGDLIATGTAGLYGLHIYVPDKTNASRSWIIPGPYIKITE